MAWQTYLAITLFAVLLILMMMAHYFTDNVYGMDYVILAIIAIFCIVLSVGTDIFSSGYKTLFLAFTFVPIAIWLISALRGRGEDED